MVFNHHQIEFQISATKILKFGGKKNYRSAEIENYQDAQ